MMLNDKLGHRAHSANMELIFRIFVFFSIVGWQQMNVHVHGYSLTNATDSVLGCSHNNTRFANGSFVPTMEPCLSCKCMNANLICALRVCPEQAFPPPRGCVIVQKKSACCPYMSCSKLHTAYKDQDKKVITHDRKWYEQNIRNRIFSQNALQRRIEESDDDQQLGNKKMCVYNGTVYRSGSAMTTSSLCSYCYCIGGKQKCVQPKCTLPVEGCEPILIDSSCCPIRYDCTDKKIIKSRYNTKYNRRRNDNKHYLRMTSRMQRSRGCLVDSTFYPEGHKLPANQTNPCEICFCIGGSKRCAPKKCAPIIKNCRPIIPEGQCCPSSYDCNIISTDYKSARGFSSRQYSDFFSLLFGDEDKENSTASWDYETETEPINTELNTTNEKGLLDAIKDSLNYVDKDKHTTEEQTNVPNQTDLLVPNIPSYNVSDDEDDEEISLLDFFLKGESAFTSTTEPFVFNITSKPLLNGMTNSPMQIQPILPDNMKNESLKFSMLPLSLYNMVKEDGSLVFGSEEMNHALEVSPEPSPKHAIKETTSEVNTQKTEVVTSSTVKSEIKTTTNVPRPTTTTKKIIIETSTLASKAKIQNNLNVNTKNPSKEIVSVKYSVNKVENTTPKISDGVTMLRKSTMKPKTTTAPLKQNIITTHASTTEKVITSTTKPASKRTTLPTKSITSTIRITTESQPTASTTVTSQSLTTKTSKTTNVLPKITAVQINSNPSILETDLNYDYSEPTLPPSLPNLKIIPFLPADAVKNVIHKSDSYKPNYNYYEPSSGSYVDPPTHTSNPAYSSFNIKPTVEKYPIYNANVADDRIDYDSYKAPAENLDSLDYINVYAGAGNMVQPASFQMSVNSKLDYESNDHKVVPAKAPIMPNKNLTVKPPLPPFEPEHEYDLYNLPQQSNHQTEDVYNEYNINAPNSNEPYSPEHNYNVPHFVTIPPLKEPPRKPTNHKESVFSYKNKFVPPEKTEGGFIPKRTAADNYIPLHAANHHEDTKVLSSNSIKSSAETSSEKYSPEESNQTTTSSEKHLISMTTDKSVQSTEEYSGPFLGVDIIGPYEKQPEEYGLLNADIGNGSTDGMNENNISFDQLYAAVHANHNNSTVSANTSELPDKLTSTTSLPATSITTPKAPQQNLTNNTIPLKLISILNNSKKENPTKIEIPQRKNNKIIDPTDEPLSEDTNMPSLTTEMPSSTKSDPQSKDENLTMLRNVFLSSLSRPPIENGDIPEELLHKSPVFLTRPINKLAPSFISGASFPGLNTLESKHNFQTNPIRSELDLILTDLEFNKNKQTNDFSHTNNFSSENYQVVPADDTHIANTESYVVNPVDIDKLNGETKIFTPPHKDPAGLLKLAGCNIYGRMYRVGRIIAELSSSCLECRCTEVGVSCTPLNC